MRRWWLAWMAGCLAGAAFAAAAWPVARPPPAAPAPARIRVVGDDSYPPFLFTDAGGKPQGYVADVWKLFERHTGTRVELRAIAWDQAKREVLAGQADVIESMYRTPERAKLFDFSAPYANTSTSVYVDRRILGVHDIASLRGFPVAVERGDACEETLRSLGIADLHPFEDYRQVIEAVVKGDQRIFCMEDDPANFYLYRYKALDRFVRAFTLSTDRERRAVRKGNAAMLAAVEQGMATITPAEREVLRKRWLDSPFVLQPYVRMLWIALAVVLALVAAMVLLGLWTRLLRRTVAMRTHELRAEERKLREVLDASPYAVCVKDRHGVHQDCNEQTLQMLRIGRDALIGATDTELLGARAGAQMRALDDAALASGRQCRGELSVVDADGNARQLEVIDVPLHLPDGSVRGVLTVANDITERLQAESELRLAAAAFEMQEALMVLAPDRTIVRVNQAFTRFTGHSAAQAIGQRSSLLRSRNHDAAFYRHIWDQVLGEGFWQGEQWIGVRQGPPRVARTTISVVRDGRGAIGHVVCSMIDLTGEREAHASVERLTFFDPLTELPNRRFLHGRLQQLLDDLGTHGGALLLIDLDHFKRVNDLHGHATGDRLLSLVAQRLRQRLEDDWVLCRFGGGSFALLVGGGVEGDARSRPELARDGAERVRAALHEPFPLGDGASATLSVSIGWSELVPGQGSPETLLKEAELAMYEAKAGGRDQVRWFEPAMQFALAHREAMLDDLRQALAAEVLELHYQAQVDRQGRTFGAEALLRWTRPDGEKVPPMEFIPVAEESGLILPLGTWVLRQACAQLVAWAAQPHLAALSLAVNVSARQFVQVGFVDEVRDALAASGANPARLELEITESVVMGNLDEAAFKLNQLRALGIRISLDDFGTGYSSLSYLSRLPLDQLKIDQSFVRHLTEDATDAMVAQTVIAMGRGLGLEVIAEGVETAAQHEFLLAQGCDAFQGFRFARPLPLPDFEAAVARQPSVA